MRSQIVIIFLFLFQICFPQSKYTIANHVHGWYMYFGDHKFTDKWGIRLEAQLRRNDLLINPQQLLLRTGVNYHFNKNSFATAGYCYVVTHPYGDFPALVTFPENRIWEQYQYKHQAARFEMVHRFRLEQRFVNAPVVKSFSAEPGPAVYTNRGRYLYRISVPFKGREITDHSLYLSFYDEVFIGFGKKVNYAFDQNRAYLALGYKLPTIGRLEVGYLNQLILKSDGVKVENNHTLQISLTSSLNFFRTAK